MRVQAKDRARMHDGGAAGAAGRGRAGARLDVQVGPRGGRQRGHGARLLQHHRRGRLHAGRGHLPRDAAPPSATFITFW